MTSWPLLSLPSWSCQRLWPTYGLWRLDIPWPDFFRHQILKGHGSGLWYSILLVFISTLPLGGLGVILHYIWLKISVIYCLPCCIYNLVVLALWGYYMPLNHPYTPWCWTIFCTTLNSSSIFIFDCLMQHNFSALVWDMGSLLYLSSAAFSTYFMSHPISTFPSYTTFMVHIFISFIIPIRIPEIYSL